MRKVLAVLVLAVLFCTNAFSSQVDMLVNKMVDLNLLTPGDAQQIITETNQDERSLIAAGTSETLPQWIQNMSFKGDFRTRVQTDWAVNTAARTRARIRARLGIDTRVTDGVKVGFGLATGINKTLGTAIGSDVSDGEPRSTNWTLQNTFSKAPLMLDYGYIEYEPVGYAKMQIGKMKGNPIWNTSDILWDTDLNLDGAALFLTHTLTPELSLFLTPEFITIDESSTDSSDPSLFAIQPGANWKVNDMLNVKAAVAYYAFNVKDKILDFNAGTNTGATTGLKNSFEALNPSIELTISDLFGYSLGLFSDYVVNNSSGEQNVGYAAGAKFGFAKVGDFGQWQVKYLRRWLQTDAFVDAFPDSDSYSGKTNALGDEIIIEIGLTKSTSLTLDYYAMDAIKGNSQTTPKSLLQADIVVKF
ncbi:MAG: putative porin [Endomicrobiales bacterium]|nr:putative porin [Endomicrobiales bacterium]